MAIKRSERTSNSLRLLFGGVCGIGAATIVQPFDLIKTRMQLSGIAGAPVDYQNTFHCIQTVLMKETPFGFYKGMGAAILRQATYVTGKLGVYTYLKERYREYNQYLPAKMMMGAISGAAGALIGAPAEVVLIRMTADGKFPVEGKRNYTSVINAMGTIIKEEGIRGLWCGCAPTVQKAMVLNMVQLGTYGHAKIFVSTKCNMKDGIGLHFCASMLSALFATAATIPFDAVKTRLQVVKLTAKQMYRESNTDTLFKIVRKEGFLVLWKGFTPFYIHLSLHSVLTFIFYEKINYLYSFYVLGYQSGTSF